MDLTTLKAEIRLLDADEAIRRLDIFIEHNPADTEALTLRGLKHFGAGHRSLAIADYLAALQIDPDCSARQALEHANSILDFYNKDLFNP
jgi:tetratricopeptide (TPR) repeat protein